MTAWGCFNGTRKRAHAAGGGEWFRDVEPFLRPLGQLDNFLELNVQLG